MKYVYIYFDPVADEPIYIGKGTGARWKKHMNRKDMHPFVFRLRRMLRNGTEPVVEIYPHVSHKAAYAAEMCLIAKYGRKDLGNGPLLNLTDGGDGQYGMSDQTRAKISASLKMHFAPQTLAKQAAEAARPQKVSRHILTDEQVRTIRSRKRLGDRTCEISKDFNIAHSLVSMICSGKRYKHVD